MSDGDAKGVLDRGPWFWAAMLLLSIALVFLLALTDAIESKAVLMLLLLIPAALMVPLGLSAQARAASGRDGCMAPGEASRSYVRRVAIFTSLYLVSFALMTFVGFEDDGAMPIRVAFALLPGLAVIGVLWAIGRLIVEEQDEFQRMLVVRQSLVATALALGASTIWGFLEAGQIVMHLDAYWVVVVWFIGLALGAVVNKVQYGAWGAV